MTEKAGRGLVRAKETVRSFHQKKETEKRPQLPALPHLARGQAGQSPQGTVVCGRVAVRALGHKNCPYVVCPLPGTAGWEGLRAALSPAGASAPCPAYPATLTRSLTSPRPPCLP